MYKFTIEYKTNKYNTVINPIGDQKYKDLFFTEIQLQSFTTGYLNC